MAQLVEHQTRNLECGGSVYEYVNFLSSVFTLCYFFLTISENGALWMYMNNHVHRAPFSDIVRKK